MLLLSCAEPGPEVGSPNVPSATLHRFAAGHFGSPPYNYVLTEQRLCSNGDTERTACEQCFGEGGLWRSAPEGSGCLFRNGEPGAVGGGEFATTDTPTYAAAKCENEHCEACFAQGSPLYVHRFTHVRGAVRSFCYLPRGVVFVRPVEETPVVDVEPRCSRERGTRISRGLRREVLCGCLYGYDYVSGEEGSETMICKPRCSVARGTKKRGVGDGPGASSECVCMDDFCQVSGVPGEMSMVCKLSSLAGASCIYVPAPGSSD